MSHHTGLVEALDEEYLHLINRLVERLERLSADSTFAHKASGLRGSLLEAIERLENHGTEVNKKELDELVEYGFDILKKAAREMRRRK